MKAARIADERLIDWSAVKPELAGGLKHGIVDLLKRRPNSVVRKTTICRWFYATPEATVNQALLALIGENRIKVVATSMNRKRRGYCYELMDAQHPTPDTDTPKPNKLAKNTRQVIDKVAAALEQLGNISLAVDDPDLAWASGQLHQAKDTLTAAAARFERKGIDFPPVME